MCIYRKYFVVIVTNCPGSFTKRHFKMISAVALLCLVAGTSAIPVPTDYYPKSQGYGGHGFNGGIIGINDNGFESSILGFNGGNSAAAASASAASGLNSAAAAAAANAVSGGSRHLGQQGFLGFNNGFNAELGFNVGNSAAASAAAAASGMNSAAAAAAAAASSAQRSSFTGFQGHSGHHFTGSNYGPFVQQVPSVQFPTLQQFNGLGGSAAAAAAAAAGQQSAAAAAAAAAGQNAAAAAAAAAGRNAAAAAAAASASGANFGPQIGIGGSQFAGQFSGQFVQPAAYYPNIPFVGQNSGAAAAAAASNNAAAAAAAAASANGFNGGIIGGSTGVIGSQFVRGKKY